MKELKFNEIITNTIKIDEENIQEYLDNCKENKISPTKDDFMDWLTGNYFIDDFIEHYDSIIEYDLTSKEFNEYLKTLNND